MMPEELKGDGCQRKLAEIEGDQINRSVPDRSAMKIVRHKIGPCSTPTTSSARGISWRTGSLRTRLLAHYQKCKGGPFRNPCFCWRGRRDSNPRPVRAGHADRSSQVSFGSRVSRCMPGFFDS
jgi:hypothetical protein